MSTVINLNQITWLWIGLLIGLSFIATPAKFLAPSLSLPEALEVGRATFGVFKIVECIAISFVAIAAWRLRHNRAITFWIALLGSLLLAQYAWLLPILDARVEIILQGKTPPPSSLHRLYIVIELAKVTCLLMLGRAANAHSPLPPSLSEKP